MVKLITVKNVWYWFALGLALILFGIGGVQGFEVENFTDGTTSGNFTFTTGTEQPTKSVLISENALVNNAYFYIKPYSIDVAVTNGSTSNASTYTATGTPFSGVLNYSYAQHLITGLEFLSDGNWNNYAQITGGELYINKNFSYVSNASIHYKIHVQNGIYYVRLYCKNKTSGATVSLYDSNGAEGIFNLSINVSPYCLSPGADLEISTRYGDVGGGYFIRLYEMQVWQNNYTQFPTNVTVKMNNQSQVFNYGSANGSSLDHQLLVNMTPYFNTSPVSLWNLSFLSNTSGILEYSGLFVSYNTSLYVYLFNEETSASLSGNNITIEILQGETLVTKTTTNGTLFYRDTLDGVYTINAYGSNYSKRNSVITASAFAYNNISFYLANQTDTVTFTVNDKLTKEGISDARVGMSRIINDQWEEISSKLTDITGKAAFSYTPNIRYRFEINASGYDTKVFYLDPILFTTYAVEMEQTGQGYYALDFEDITADIEPERFVADQLNYLNVTIGSIKGILNTYSISVCYPGGCNTSSGSASHGEMLSTVFNITGATTFSMVYLNITYNTDLSGSRTYSYTYLIQGAVYGPYTWIANRENPTGAGWVERIMIATFFIILVAGIVTYVAGPLAGGAVALIFFGMAAYLRFIPVWAAIITIIVGFFILSKRASE